MIFKKITEENYLKGVEIQGKIFPEEEGSFDILNSLSLNSNLFNMQKYYLIEHDGIDIGIIGVYSYYIYPDDVWLGWFGILEEYRGKNLGKRAFKKALGMLKKENYINFRLYTDSIDNYVAVNLYRSFNMKEEVYLNEKNKYYSVGDTLVFSKALNSRKLSSWNNKCLFLECHENLEKKLDIRIEKLCENNFVDMVKIQYSIFNEVQNFGLLDYLDEVKDNSENNSNKLPVSFLVYYENEPVGIVGLYEMSNYPNDIWLNWFGVLPEYRSMGIGTEMILFILKYALKYERKNFRLFTYEKWHVDSQPLFKKIFTMEEKYYNKKDDQYLMTEGVSKIFSISLYDKRIKKFNNKFINLVGEKQLHIKSVKHLNKMPSLLKEIENNADF